MELADFQLKTPYNYTQGFVATRLALSQTPLKAPTFTQDIGELGDDSKAVLKDLVDYCDTLDADVLFVVAPCSMSYEMGSALNATAAYVEELGADVLNCNSAEICEEIGFDWSTDFYNTHHTNYLGAEKYTTYLTTYLKDHYDLPDRRGQGEYEVWQKGYEYYLDFVKDGIKYHESGDEDGE